MRTGAPVPALDPAVPVRGTGKIALSAAASGCGRVRRLHRDA